MSARPASLARAFVFRTIGFEAKLRYSELARVGVFEARSSSQGRTPGTLIRDHAVLRGVRVGWMKGSVGVRGPSSIFERV
jgi:hypothetical protein